MRIVISTKKLECTVFRITVNNAHDLLSSSLLFLSHDLTSRIKTIMKSTILLQKVFHPIRPYPKVVTTFKVISFRKPTIACHREVSPTTGLWRTLTFSFYGGHRRESKRRKLLSTILLLKIPALIPCWNLRTEHCPGTELFKEVRRALRLIYKSLNLLNPT